MKRVIFESMMNLSENYMEVVQNMRPAMKNSGIAYANNARSIFGIRGHDLEAAKAVDPEFELAILSMTHSGGKECRYILRRKRN